MCGVVELQRRNEERIQGVPRLKMTGEEKGWLKL